MVDLFLNTATVQPASLEEKLRIAARAGYAGVELFAAVCDWARAFDLLVGYEAVGHVGKTSRVREAWDLVRSVKRPNAGLFLDVFHFYRAGCTEEDLRDIGADRILGIHLCDAIPLSREELLGFRHRAVPGEGILPFDALLRLFWQAGYRDYFAVEILNPDLWEGDLLALASRAAQACQAAFASVAGERDVRSR